MVLVDTSLPRQRGSLPRRHYFSKIQKLINFKKTVLEYHAKIWTCMGPCLEEHVRSGCCFSCTRLLLRLIWYGCTAVHSCTLNRVCVYHGVYMHIDMKRYLPGTFHYEYYLQQRSTGSRQQQIYWLLRSCRLLLLYHGAVVVRQYCCSTTVLLMLYLQRYGCTTATEGNRQSELYRALVPFWGVSMSYPKGMYVCEERVARAWVSVRVLRYMYINIYTRVYIGKNMSEY